MDGDLVAKNKIKQLEFVFEIRFSSCKRPFSSRAFSFSFFSFFPPLFTSMNWTGVFIVPPGFDLRARKTLQNLAPTQCFHPRTFTPGSSWPKNKSRIQMNSNVLMFKAVESITSQSGCHASRRRRTRMRMKRRRRRRHD